MGLIFGAGAMLMALFVAFRLLPKLVGLTVWLGTVGFSAVMATLVIYMVMKGSP